MVVKQMLDQFYSLSGKTVAEKLKYLNHLISDVKSGCSQHEIDEFIAEIHPKNAFEKLLKGRLIDSFQRSRELIDVLKSDDKLFIKQVLGCDWFFEGCVADFPSCEYFMTEVFPNTSFSARNRIIHMLSVHLKDISLAEQLFEAVKSQYGIKQAKCLLCNCSANFIQSVLDNDDSGEVHFTKKEIIKLCKLHPNFVKHNIDKKYFADLASYILQVMLDLDVKIFVEMFENVGTCNVHLKIGRRASKKIIRSHPDGVIKSAAQYLRILEPRQLFKYLTLEEFKLFYIKLFPESFENSGFFKDDGDFYNVVDVFPPSERLEMLLGCFEMVYGKSLLTQTNLVGEKLLNLLPPDQREQCAQQRIDKCLKENVDETYWMCYLKTERSIPQLKKYLLEASNFDKRSKFISFLILTCKVNEDLEALDSVCKHIVSRHRNDNFSLRVKFLSDLRDEFDLLKLEDKHWSSVMEMIKLFFLNEEHQRNTDLVSDILAKSIHYNLNRSADISEQVDKLIIINTSLCSTVDDWLILENDPKYQQVIFQAFGERIPCITKGNVPLTEVALSFLKSVVTWNKEHTLFHLSLSKFPWVVESLRKIIQTDLDLQKILLDLFTYDLETQVLFSDCVFESITEKDFIYFLKMDTEHLIQNAEEVVQFLLANNIEKYKRVFRTWNLLSFTQIKETVVHVCSKIIENDPDTHKRENAIFVLSFLMEADSFSSLIAPFCPVTGKIAVQSDETEKMLPLSKTSAMCLKNVNPWHDYGTVTQFCKGDYLKYVLGSLISVCYNTSENKVVPFLEKLTNSPVSLKKHAMRLSFIVVRKPQILPLLNKLWNGDRNPATREILFRLVFLALLAHRKRDMFDLFKYCLGSLTVDDKNLFYELSEVSPIPDDFKVEYVQLGWHKLHDLLHQGANTKSMISCLASVFHYMADLLPADFCENVLKQYLIKHSSLWDECVQLAAAYIVHSKTRDVLEARFDFILSLLKDFDDDVSIWGNISQFFRILRTQAVSSDHKSLSPQIIFQLLQKCVAIWPSFLSPMYSFDNFILMQFTILYYSCAPECDLQVFGRLSSGYVLSLIEEYGQETIILVSKTFKQLLDEIKYHGEYSEWMKIPLHVITGVLKGPSCKYNYIIAAHLIPDNFNSYEDVKDRYINIMRSLLRTEDTAVSLLISSLSVFKNNFALLDLVENTQVT